MGEMSLYYIGLFVAVLLMLFVRNIIINASNKLEDDKKLLLFSVFKTENKIKGLVLISLFALYLLLVYFQVISYIQSTSFFFISIIVFLTIFFFIKLKKLKINNYPDFYIRKFTLASMLLILVAIITFISVLTTFYV